MKKTVATIVLGILFGAALGGLAYLSIFVGWALSIAGYDILSYALYVFIGLAISTIIGACLAKKNIVVTRVLLTIPLVFTAAFLIISLVLVNFSTILLFYVAAIALGLVPTILAYKTPKQVKEEQPAQTTEEPIEQ